MNAGEARAGQEWLEPLGKGGRPTVGCQQCCKLQNAFSAFIRVKNQSVRRREGDLEAGAAEFGGAADLEFAAVGGDDVLDDGQADAVALHAFVAAHALLEDVLDV